MQHRLSKLLQVATNCDPCFKTRVTVCAGNWETHGPSVHLELSPSQVRPCRHAGMPCHILVEQLVRLLGCMLTACPISSHTCPMPHAPLYLLCALIFTTFQHLQLMPARLHATRSSDLCPGVTSCCARLLLPGMWQAHACLGTCDLEPPVSDVWRWWLEHSSGRTSLARACAAWGVRALRRRAQRSEPRLLLVVQPPSCCRAGMCNSSPAHVALSAWTCLGGAGTCGSTYHWQEAMHNIR